MTNPSTRLERAQKPRKCPECGHAPLASILYGMPAFTEELSHKMDEGRITLGGCCIGDEDPAWECTRCGLQIFRKKVQ